MSEPFKFQSIQETEEFNGLENDANHYMPPEPVETYINEYGVRVRGTKKAPNHDDGDDLVVFSVNRG